MPRRQSTRAARPSLASDDAPVKAGAGDGCTDGAARPRITFQDLPTEVLSLICNACTPKSLLRLAATSNALYELASASTSSYWSSLTLSAITKEESKGEEDPAVGFLKFLALRPHLAVQLRDVHIHTAQDGNKERNTVLFKQLAKVLRRAPAVRMLWLHGESYTEELPTCFVDLMVDRIAAIEDISLVAICWPTHHQPPIPRKLSKPPSTLRTLQRLSVIASASEYLSHLVTRVDEIGLLELSHMHADVEAELPAVDCDDVWRRVRGLVVGVHATNFAIDGLERAKARCDALSLATLHLHELLPVDRLVSLQQLLGPMPTLTSVALGIPALPSAGVHLDIISQLAPRLVSLALNLDWLGCCIDRDARSWVLYTRRGPVVSTLPDYVESWQSFLHTLIPHLTATAFPCLERLVIRRPGIIDWTGRPSTGVEPDHHIQRFFDLAFTRLPTLSHGAQLTRCMPSKKAERTSTVAAREVAVDDEDEAAEGAVESVVIHDGEEGDEGADLDHGGGILTAASFTWSRRPSGEQGGAAKARRVTALKAGVRHYAVKQSAFADELPSS